MILSNRLESSHTLALFSGSLGLLLFLATTGCGGGNGQPPSEPAASDVAATGPQPSGSTFAPGFDSGDTDGTPPSSGQDSGPPPGKIALPDDFDPTSVPQPEENAPSNGPKNGGLKLPPLDDQSATPTPETDNAALIDGPGAASSYRFAALVQDQGVSLKAASWEEILAVVTKTGKVTVVDVWSLACEPCLKEFPGLVEVDRDFGDRIACIAVDSDFDGRKTKPAESYRPAVEAFLTSVGAKFPNFLCTTPNDDLFTELEIESIPAVLIYDAQGKLIRKFVDAGEDAGFTYHDNIIPYLRELVAKP